MAKYASGKIPFADAPNPPHPAHRTPGQGAPKASAKSSPHYPNGDHINLPEIPTDSEDEYSDNEQIRVPAWAQQEELEITLGDQERRMDPDLVFGPIAELRMEELFSGGSKSRKQFRDRTSSANWAGPDGLTRDEILKDIAERERLRRNGGWTYGT
jgi:hypothetical protein